MSDRVTIQRDLKEPAATAMVASTLARGLEPGDVVALSGPMGAGKTTLVRALAAAMGAGEVSSPTFLVIAEHPTSEGFDLVHVDAYRLGGADELDALGWDRFEAPDGMEARVLIAEWPERLGEALAHLAGGAERLAHLSLAINGRTSRRLRLDLPPSWAQRSAIGALLAREPIRCRISGVWVAPDNPAWPFADERERLADLHKWFAGDYRLSRPIEQTDLEEGE